MADAIHEVIAAFAGANLVGLGERHWAREDADFRLRLIRDPDFARAANDIAVEFANPLHQQTLDRFIWGEGVAANELQQVWRDTTQPGAWDSPVYEEFLRAVRERNGDLPAEQRLRVVAADQPVDWSGSSLPDWQERERAVAAVIEREVMNRGRKALALFGALHLYRCHSGTMAGILERNSQARWFVIVPVGGPGLPDAIAKAPASATEPAFLRLAQHPAGDLAANDVFERGMMRVEMVDGKPLLKDGRPVLVPAQGFDPQVKAREAADACLWFGPEPPGLANPPRELYAGAYGREVQRRREVLWR